jgi:hypothetical protein
MALMANQSLQLSDVLFPQLLNGAKRCTIRLGYRGIGLGELRFECSSNPKRWAVVRVCEIRHKRLSGLTDFEAELGGLPTAQAMKHSLARYYPDMNDDSEITVIIFDDLIAHSEAEQSLE